MPCWNTRLLSNFTCYKHVFQIFLETAPKDAWPFHQERFCRKNGVRFNEKVSNKTITPFFDRLVHESYRAERFHTTARYTVKAQFSANCGVYPSHQETAVDESQYTLSKPCLQQIFNKHGFETAFYQGATNSWDHTNEILNKTGFRRIYGSEQIQQERASLEMHNWLGFSEADAMPGVWDWIDRSLQRKKRMALELFTVSSHHRKIECKLTCN